MKRSGATYPVISYVSTRGRAPELGFADVLLAGLAADGGLYVPAEYPALPDLARTPDYASAAAAVMAPFVGDELGRGALGQLRPIGGYQDVFEHGRSPKLVRMK